MDEEDPLELGTVKEESHLAQIKKLLQAHKSPTAIRNHCALADQNANPFYSVQEVEQICLYLSNKYQLVPPSRVSGSVRTSSMLAQAPTVVAGAAASKEAQASNTFLPVQRQSPVSNGTRQFSLVQQDASIKPREDIADLTPYSVRAASAGSLSFLPPASMQIWSPDVQGKILVKAQTFDAIMAELQAKSAFKDKGELRLFFCTPSSEGQQPLWVDSDEIFQMMLLETHGQWEVRLQPQTPQQTRLSGGPIRQGTGISRQLTYELSDPLEIPAGEHRTSLVAAQAQVKYGHAIRSQLKEIVAEALNKFDKKIPSGPLPRLLIALHKLEKAWVSYVRDGSDLDGVAPTKKLEWFVEWCIKALDHYGDQRWRVLEEKYSTQASAYQSLDQFFIQLIQVVTPAGCGVEPASLFRDLAKTFDPRAFNSLESVMAEVADVTHAARLLDKLSGMQQHSLVEAAEITFWCDCLSDEALDDIAKELAKVSTPKTSLFSMKAIAPVTAYRLEDILVELHKRTGLRADWKRLFKARTSQIGGARGVSTNSKVSTRTERAPSTVTPEGPRLRQFNYQGIIETVPYYLTDLVAAEEREAACKTFLKHTIFPKAFCKNCKQSGHKIFVCPLFSKLKGDIETNERSFFFGVKPPAAVRQLANKTNSAAVMLVAPESSPAAAVPVAAAEDLLAAVSAAVQAAVQQSLNDRAGAAP